MITVTYLPAITLPEPIMVTLADRLAAGRYDLVKEGITEQHFPLILPPGPRQLLLAHFNKVMPSDLVDRWALDNGCQVGRLDDLLAVGCHVECRELQRQFPIVGLGSSAVIAGGRRVPCLGGSVAARGLFLDWYRDGWDAGCRFLLRKVPVAT